MSAKSWIVRPTSDADRDFVKILQWTRRAFGARQMNVYGTTLLRALRALRSGPDIIGAKRRDDLGPGVRILHVARDGRKGSHFIVFRVNGERTIDVLRILYDGMDLASHLSS
jgi:toxin ParE1/3/4